MQCKAQNQIIFITDNIEIGHDPTYQLLKDAEKQNLVHILRIADRNHCVPGEKTPNVKENKYA